MGGSWQRGYPRTLGSPPITMKKRKYTRLKGLIIRNLIGGIVATIIGWYIPILFGR